MLNGKFRPEQYRPNQTGGSGIAGMYADNPYMIPVNPHVDNKEEEKVVVGKQVTPMAAEVERAKSELKDAIREDRPHVPINKKRSTKSISSKRIVEEATPFTGFNIFNKKARK
ncbi:hypothetical protein KUTeg_004363 [Tegillarca granosa]|uniref:Uncharacterized protein n=1 Tax=Tegillarca granosa TaxID=220873 RepID=A0ABQ9FTF7_TEGGR|nr:hypothetical protein KUTeg_004363 [Tegillarca granosa]